MQRDKEYLRANTLENQVTELKRQPDKLRAEITRLKHLEHDCQAIKANGERCDHPAKGKVDFHSVLINVCLQHQTQLLKKQTESESKLPDGNLQQQNDNLIEVCKKLKAELATERTKNKQLETLQQELKALQRKYEVSLDYTNELEDKLQKGKIVSELQPTETTTPEQLTPHTKADRTKIKKLAKEKYELVKADTAFDPILKSKLAGLSGAYSGKLYSELVFLGILPPLENNVINAEQEKAKLNDEEAARVMAEQPKTKRPILNLKRNL